ncbi:hypothetical protein ACIP5L_28915 [Streptomyces bacillaris]|uniref:hypothetical protein n=1 Tax=Streptomyces bacillaris TaxID=68179 RepID=UPI00381E04CC
MATWRSGTAALAAATVLLATGCGGSDGGGGAASGGVSPTPAVQESPAGAEPTVQGPDETSVPVPGGTGDGTTGGQEKGAGAGTGTGTGAGGKEADAATEAGAGGGGAVALPGLSVAVDPELGEIVVDAKGRTLYRFTKDTAWPMTTACTGACLEKWKPAAVVAKNDVKGIASKLVIPFDRPDGTKQQTLDCWPLYWFTGDKPGEVNGQGVGGTWFAVAPDGSLVGK